MATHREGTGTDPGGKSAAEIEREVRQSRADVEETLDAIQERLSPGQLFDQALGYFRGGGGEFVRNLGGTISHNPVPVTLVGIGLAWMMMSDQRSRRSDDRSDLYDDDDLGFDEPFDEPYGMAGTGAGTGPSGYDPLSYDPLGDSSAGTGSSLGERAGKRVSGLSEKASEFGERAGGRASELAERAREAASGAKDRARDFGDQAGERMADARADLANRAERTRLRAGRYGRRARQTAYQTFTDHPLVLGALGLAVGAALGAVVPPTETEDEYLGKTGDKLQRRAGEAAREQVAKARSAAESAYAAAQDEAENQGLTPDAAQDASRSTADKAGKVVDAARSAAEKELRSAPEQTGSTSHKPTSA